VQTEDLRDAMVALQPRLRRFAYGLAGSLDEADDLVQSAFERALTRLHQWKPGTRVDSWMYRILQSIWVNRYHAGRVRGEHYAPIDPDLQSAGNLSDEVEAQLTLESVRRFVAGLPEEQRSVLMLVTVEGMSYRETAQTLGIPEGTVTSRLARARAALRSHVDGEDVLASTSKTSEQLP